MNGGIFNCFDSENLDLQCDKFPHGSEPLNIQFRNSLYVGQFRVIGRSLCVCVWVGGGGGEGEGERGLQRNNYCTMCLENNKNIISVTLNKKINKGYVS